MSASPTMAAIAASTADAVRARAERALREEAARHFESIAICIEGGLWRDGADHARLLQSALLALDENRSAP